MTRAALLGRARALFTEQAWGGAFEVFSNVNRSAQLAAEDLERLAVAAYLSGRPTESSEAWAVAHQLYLQRGNVERSVRCAFWLAFGLFDTGDQARAGGWVARARRLLDDGQRDCVESGYLLIPVAFQSIMAGDNDAAYETFTRSAEIAARFDDADLAALARNGQGRALIRCGRLEDGISLLDETMAAIEAGAVSAIVAGDVYCSVIEACHEILDMRRAQQWTAALTHWCESQPELVQYRGQCLIRRAEILQLHGEWQDAMLEAERACERLSQPPPHPAIGAALYQRAELHRLRGEFVQAEAAYRESARWMRRQGPGLPLLLLAQGHAGAALSAISPLLDDAQGPLARCKLLAAYVEIALANADAAAARAATSELNALAHDLDAPLLHAVAAYADGSVLLAEGDAHAALSALRRAWRLWQELDAPYELARVSVLTAIAARALGDGETFASEIDAARTAFRDLSAVPDLDKLEPLARATTNRNPGGLSARELEVLRLIAAGKTNRKIASTLFISEKTVARHVSNIFTKLDLSTRSAAAAYAVKHNLT